MNDQMLNIQFVQEVEKYPCLYNYTLTDYSRRDVTEKAWSEVGKKVNLTGSQCKEKWKNIRAVFVRHMKPDPSGSSAKKKKSYYLNDAMQFTIPYIRTLSGNLPDVHHEETNYEEDNKEFVDCNYMLPSPSEHHQKVQANCDNTVMDYLSAKKPTMDSTTDNALDSRKMFLLSLQHDVNSMTDAQMRTFKRKVLAVVDEIFEEPTH